MGTGSRGTGVALLDNMVPETLVVQRGPLGFLREAKVLRGLTLLAGYDPGAEAREISGSVSGMEI